MCHCLQHTRIGAYSVLDNAREFKGQQHANPKQQHHGDGKEVLEEVDRSNSLEDKEVEGDSNNVDDVDHCVLPILHV